MREIKNISNNPLELSDGKMIAPGDTRKLETISDRDKDFQNRGWLTIAEPAEKPTAQEAETLTQKTEGGKK